MASEVRLVELLAALSLAADAGAGQPAEHSLRTCALACRLAAEAGLGEDAQRDVFYVALLRSIGCTSDAHEQAALFGNEVAARAELNLAAHLSPRELLAALARHATSKRVLVSARGLRRAIAAAHCDAAERLAGRLGIHASARRALLSVFERWDGTGFPRALAGEQIPVAVRFAQVAYDAILLRGVRGADGAVAAVRRASGKLFDPAVVALLVSTELDGDGEPWDAALAADPDGIVLDDEGLDAACRAAGDFADLKSPWLLGHSAAVAELAEAAGWRLHLDAAELRRAALLHDLGRVAVSSGIWDRPGPLGHADWEAVRLHPYHVERFLDRSPTLVALGLVAGGHHERLDGSGYHRGATAAQLSAPARVLAAADAFQAMTERRPHRAALPAERAADELLAGARAGRLDADAVDAVLAAAGQRRAHNYRELPAGLTAREAQVLVLLARGLTNRQIAARLVISPKTVGRHLEHVYAKAAVSTRAAAALFALEQGLLEMGYSPDVAAAAAS
ncbi:MAG TPA: HD domain-containing phosphohydrolase [Gaiellaceae bacterium]|nr:HD domain-containing phosphohydrolase [Gaiellaceae bacterium]